MKHLRSYTLFESIDDDLIQTVKDILLPINDMGYDISVTKDDDVFYKRYYSQLSIRVVSWIDKPLLLTDEVKDEFMRMKDYLESEGYSSIEAYYHKEFNGIGNDTVVKQGRLSNSSRDIKELDDFINTKQPITNLLFCAKKDPLKKYKV